MGIDIDRCSEVKQGGVACFACHLSWTRSCAGCHLPIKANWKKEANHFEGEETRNWASYNPQVVRDDQFILGLHGTVKRGGRKRRSSLQCGRPADLC